MEKQNFYDLNYDQLKNFLIEKVNIENNKANMRAQQMFNAVYKNNIKNFDELTTLSLDLREKIKKLQVEVSKRSELEDKFNQDIEELSQETENLVNEVEKWQM